jgi:preprotein translocase subunit SecA
MIIHAGLFLQHYTVELKSNNIDLTEDGVAHAEIILGTDDLWDENDPWARCCHCLFFM